MKTLFLWIIKNFYENGDVLEANMYKGGNFANVTVEFQGCKYKISISKEKETDGNGNN